MQERFEKRTAPGISQSTLIEVVILQFKYLFSADFKTVKEIWKRSPRFWWKLFWHKWNQAWHEVGAGSGQANGTDPGRIETNWGNCFKMQLDLPEKGGKWRAQTFHQYLDWCVSSGVCFQEMQGPTRVSLFLPPPLGKRRGWCLLNGALWGLEDSWLLMNSIVVGSREEGQKGRMCVTNSLSLQHLFTLEGQQRWGSVSTEVNPWVIVGAFFQDLVVLSLEDKWASSLGCESGFHNSWALIAASSNARPRATLLCEEAQELP